MKLTTRMLVVTLTLVTALAIQLQSAAQQQTSDGAPPITPNPVPLINQPLAPDAAKPGGPGFTLTVNGAGFVSSSIVKWNGSARATTFVSKSRLKATILSSDIAKATTASVTVVNPVPGGGTSNAGFFEVTTPTHAVSLNTSHYGVGDMYARPQSIVAADFNGDGILDLAVAINNSTVSVLLGNGDGTFKPQVDYATSLYPASLAVGDFNGDGKVDLVVATAGGPTVGVLLGNGDGTFKPHVDYAIASSSVFVAVGDFNGDGKLDVVTANEGNNTVSVLLGNGDGTFQVHIDYATGDSPMSMAVGDFNGDGKLDLVTANYNIGTVSILLGKGDGTFEPQVEYNAGEQPISMAVADFNGDGKLDLVVANYPRDTVSVLLGNGDGTFKPQVDYPTGLIPDSVAVGDFNGDGKVDLVVANGGDSTVGVLLGNGDGTFQAHVDYSVGSDPAYVTVGDFNHDGRLDLAVANASTLPNGTTVSVLLQSPTASFSTKTVQFTGQLIGTSSVAQTVTLSNTGYLTLKIASLAITGVDATEFSQTHTCGSSVPPGASCTISVTFKPTHIGPRTASVTITDNGVGSPQSVALGGTGVVPGPNPVLSSSRLTFVPQILGTSSPVQLVILSNYGSVSLSLVIATSGDFNQTNNCGSSLAAAASCWISVTFKPAQTGTRTGTLSFRDNAAGSPQIVSLTGFGTAQTVVTLLPSQMFFSCGLHPFGPCPPQKATLTNVGNNALYINSITITGSGQQYFAQASDCGMSLGAGQSCGIWVRVPRRLAAFQKVSALLSVNDTGEGSPQTISLTGAGGPP